MINQKRMFKRHNTIIFRYISKSLLHYTLQIVYRINGLIVNHHQSLTKSVNVWFSVRCRFLPKLSKTSTNTLAPLLCTLHLCHLWYLSLHASKTNQTILQESLKSRNCGGVNKWVDGTSHHHKGPGNEAKHKLKHKWFEEYVFK